MFSCCTSIKKREILSNSLFQIGECNIDRVGFWSMFILSCRYKECDSFLSVWTFLDLIVLV